MAEPTQISGIILSIDLDKYALTLLDGNETTHGLNWEPNSAIDDYMRELAGVPA